MTQKSDFRIDFDRNQPEHMTPPPPPPESDTSPPFNKNPNARPDAHFDPLDADSGSVRSDVPRERRRR